MGRLQDKVMLITGSGSGLGREVALLAAEEGARVVVSDLNEARIGPVVETIQVAGGTATGVHLDVREEASVEAGFAHALETFGRLDIVHANAGVAIAGKGATALEDFTVEQWNETNDPNFLGVFLTVKHAVRAMKENESGGSIVVTSSSAAVVAYPRSTAYAAGKAGVNGFVRAAAWEIGEYGIRINAVCPAHGMSANLGMEPDAPVLGLSWSELDGDWSRDKAVMPLKLPFPPALKHNAQPVIFLASEESQYMSGVCFPTGDGAQLARVSIPFPDNWTLDAQAGN